jgi:hypothetical protein
MKYQQPYGVSDPNAAYINGNPSTGTMGSIPPAASIEFPQREIVATITDAGLTPADTDLSQLAKAIQSGQLNYKHDTGTANNYAANLSPNPGSYFEGLGVILKILNANTGASVLNLNSLGNKPIMRSDGVTPLSGGDLAVSSLVYFLYDGTAFRMVWAQSAATTGMPIYLTAPRTYYVNGTTGNDSYDGTQATVGTGIHGPFATLQKAANQIPLFNINGWSITINVANGTYAPFSMPPINGSGQIYWVGNTATPSSVLISGVNATAVWAIDIGGVLNMEGFKLQSTGSSSTDACVGFAAVGPETIVFGNMEFGTCVGAHVSVQRGALLSNKVPGCAWIISGGCAGNAFLPGSFINGYVNGNLICHVSGGPTITITAAISFGSFISAFQNSYIALVYTSMTGGGGVSGKRFDANYNSTIQTSGGGANYYPGTIAGTALNGSYYV